MWLASRFECSAFLVLLITLETSREFAEASYVISKIVNPGPEPKVSPTLRQDLYEGDILVQNQNGYRSAIVNKNKRWADNRVPFIMDPRLPRQARTAIEAAIEDYKKYTCMRYVPRTSERDYVKFMAGDGCYSIIGRNGGMQPISIGRGCEIKGVAIHEMMHTLGFYHEQSRSDRDSYVSILYSNIAKGLSDQFHKEQTDNQGLPYDFSSVMHYEATAFSVNGKAKTIIPKVSGVSIGQRRGLSEEDIKKISLMYGCQGTATTPAATEAPTQAPETEEDEEAEEEEGADDENSEDTAQSDAEAAPAATETTTLAPTSATPTVKKKKKSTSYNAAAGATTLKKKRPKQQASSTTRVKAQQVARSPGGSTARRLRRLSSFAAKGTMEN